MTGQTQSVETSLSEPEKVSHRHVLCLKGMIHVCGIFVPGYPLSGLPFILGEPEYDYGNGTIYRFSSVRGISLSGRDLMNSSASTCAGSII